MGGGPLRVWHHRAMISEPEIDASVTTANTDHRLRDLAAGVARIGPVITETVPLTWSGRRLSITRPTNMDELLDRVALDPEQNLPYWAELWPSGIALADAILTSPESVRGQSVLEIGCGAGTTAAAALLAGADLTVIDYAPDALTLCRYNCRVNTQREPFAAFQSNWRLPDDASTYTRTGGFPVVLAADALYERRDIEPLLTLAEHVVAPDGVLWLAEPGRAVAARFLDLAREHGWSISSSTHAGPWPDPADRDVVVGLHELRRI